MLTYFYNLFWNWRTNEKVRPESMVTFVSNIILSKNYSDKKYYNFCKKIRNFEPLSNE